MDGGRSAANFLLLIGGGSWLLRMGPIIEKRLEIWQRLG